VVGKKCEGFVDWEDVFVDFETDFEGEFEEVAFGCDLIGADGR
jgi:hypothetical protein